MPYLGHAVAACRSAAASPRGIARGFTAQQSPSAALRGNLSRPRLFQQQQSRYASSNPPTPHPAGHKHVGMSLPVKLVFAATVVGSGYLWAAEFKSREDHASSVSKTADEITSKVAEKKAEASAAVGSAASKVKDASESIKGKVKSTAESVKAKAEGEAERIAGVLEGQKGRAAGEAEKLKAKAEGVKAKVEGAVDHVKGKLEAKKQSASDAVEEAKGKAKVVGQDLKNKVSAKKEEAEDLVEDGKRAAAEKAGQLKHKVDEKKSQASDAIEAGKQKAKETGEQLKAKASSAKAQASEAVEAGKEKAQGLKEDAKDKVKAVKDDAKSKVEEGKAKVAEASAAAAKEAESAKDKLAEKASELKKDASAKAQGVQDAAKEKLSAAGKTAKIAGQAVAAKASAPIGDLHLEPLDNDPTVVFVLGGPGAGKGTQCANLVRDYSFVHLSAGDLLRAERNRPDSEYGELINTYIKEGQIVPMEITIALLHKAMKESGASRFLVDGFPRKMDQALKFEEAVVPSKFTLYFECPEEEMLKRLLKRGETSGRVDDNLDSIKKRFKVFEETSFPVIKYYEDRGKVRTISCKQPIDKVYAETKRVVEEQLDE
ncbi:adenylate kinase-domain-containing protein [Fimicolochytrium jonesii]|uniref:adenylate kinase-domain-containing protein n=1 Tax=Fimicolochytrium jonesii TaxID=1396493 RepID=UPI0022FE5A94|nr:adenylate kinase-domain-containing protein [Fimicolochytrium jonesii]KAI8816703.1 adenylate kinase-domain-containing protein [Fimicolochytrium jonesii]